MRYSLNKIEHRNFKARITERLVEKYIEEISIPQLRKEGYDFAFFDLILRRFLPIPLDDVVRIVYTVGPEDADLEEIYNELINSYPEYRSHPEYRSLENWKETKISEVVRIVYKLQEFYLSRDVFPSKELLDRTIGLTMGLEVATDGLLFKLNKTGKTVSKNSNAISGVLQRREKVYFPGFRYAEKDDLPDNIPIVSGDIEIVEVKADKASIPPHQRENYRLAIENGYPLRYFHVFIISFENNQFEVEERSLENVDDLKETIRLFRKVGRDRKLLSHR